MVCLRVGSPKHNTHMFFSPFFPSPNVMSHCHGLMPWTENSTKHGKEIESVSKELNHFGFIPADQGHHL